MLRYKDLLCYRTDSSGIRPVYASKVLAALVGPALQKAVAAATEAVEAKSVAAIAEASESKQALMQANARTESYNALKQSWVDKYKRMKHTAQELSLLLASNISKYCNLFNVLYIL